VTTLERPPLSQLDVLESEGIHIIREVAAEFERPALLFSGGKDSIVVLALAVKAFAPAPLPFPLLHVDTGHNFPEALDYRDRRVCSTTPWRASMSTTAASAVEAPVTMLRVYWTCPGVSASTNERRPVEK
jgi:3'-phosphoadenosine 5'-phosphosulfate sulfotransferase (PAPS reductase)/FAD synthetase